MRFETGVHASERSRNKIWSVDYGQLTGNPNYQLLVDAAKLLKPILGVLVFVGGCTTGILEEQTLPEA